MSDKNINGHIFEGIISFSAVCEGIISGINKRKIKTLYYSSEKLEKSAHEFSYIKAKSYELSFEIKLCHSEELSLMTGDTTHGGIVFECSEREFSHFPLSDISNGFFVMLDGIEDPYNLGYALRSVYASGASGVILPKINRMNASGIVCRSSAGASERMPIYICESAIEIAEMKKQYGFTVICSDTENSVPLQAANFSLPLLLVIGGEKRGISKGITALSDETVRIDYGREFKEALSAASAAAILSFEAARRSGIIK